MKTQRRADRSLPGVALYNNKITLFYAQSKAEGIQNRFVPLDRIAKEKVRCSKQRTFWWGAQWDSNPRSPDPQSGALTDYAMGTTSMRPKGLEPPAHCLEGSCSIHLSYGRTLLSQWVPLWRQRCVGTGCERNNTIPIAFCQGKSEKSFNFFALRAKMAVPACRNGLTAATFRHSPAQSPVQSRTPRPAHDAPR